MGEVYRAIDMSTGRAVALKRLPEALSRDPEFRARFESESSLLCQMEAPHIVSVLDVGEVAGRMFIAMKLVHGADLAAYLAQCGPLPTDMAVAVIRQVASALDAAHAAGIVHRDIKPSNILLASSSGENGTTAVAAGSDGAYVADFGLAQAIADSGQLALTVTGGIAGTPEYVAPERYVKGFGDHRVDIYALGCVLYECLTGKTPFRGDGFMAQMFAHVNEDPPRPSGNAQKYR